MKRARASVRWRKSAIGILLCSSALEAASAADFDLGSVSLRVHGTITYGTAFRADDRDPSLLPPASAAAIGAVGRAPGGQNADDGNLNFDRGDRVSSVLKAVGGVGLKYQSVGAYVGAKAWRDFVLGEDGVSWGHVPNGYLAGAPLTDSNFHRLAQFSGVELMDAYLHGDFAVANKNLFLRVGKQTIPWSTPGTIRGGLDQINAYDIPAIVRPGAVPEEFDIPAAAVFARLKLSDQTNVEAFYQFRFEPNQIPGCGTFNSHADYAALGCDKVVVGPLNDRLAIEAGLFAKRASDRYPSDEGQFGIGFTHVVEGLGRFGTYFANIHSRRWVPSPIKSTRIGLPPLIPGDPDGRNVRYFIEYPENARILGLTFVTRLPDGSAFFAELTHQPNQPVRLNGTDLLNAFASNVAPSLLRADALATPAGAEYHGFDRLRVTQLKFGGSKPLNNVFTVAGEAGMSYVHSLPDPSLRRYGRADPYGIGPVSGVCAGPPTQCSNDGFVTSLSWGYRIRLSAILPGLADGMRLKPSFAFGHDVKGWSPDEVFSEKRRAAILALRGEILKRYFVEISWTALWGGRYDVSKDRDVVAAHVGVTF